MKSKYKERLIDKYGIEKGTEMYNTWYNSICLARKRQYDISYYIEKYGEIQGPKKLQEFKNKTAGSKKSYINRYGKKIGIIKYNEFRNKCSVYTGNTSEEGLLRYKNRKNVVSFDYFLEKCDGCYEKAILLYKDRQNTSSLDKFIKRYGEELGYIKYKENVSKKIKKFEGKSNLEISFIKELILMLDKPFLYYYDENKHLFFTDREFRKKYNKKVIISDLFIKDLNLCIEIHGDFWHLNPLKYDYNYYSKFHGKLASEVWIENSDRIKFLKNKYNVNTIVVWENDIKKNKKQILNLILEKINGICETS